MLAKSWQTCWLMRPGGSFVNNANELGLNIYRSKGVTLDDGEAEIPPVI